MKRSRFFLLTTGICIVALCVSCSIPRKFLYVEGKGKIAVASFSVDKSIVEEGTESSTGPGLLQNKENYFEQLQTAVESMWGQVKDSLAAVFGSAEFIPFDAVFSNPKYIEATTYAPVKLMGLQMTPGENDLTPSGCRFVDSYDKKTMNALFEPLGADFLLVFENTAALRPNAAGKQLIIGEKALIVLTTKITLYHKSGEYAWSTVITSLSDSDARMINHEIAKDQYPILLPQAHAKIFKEIRDEIELGKKKAAEGAIQ